MYAAYRTKNGDLCKKLEKVGLRKHRFFASLAIPLAYILWQVEKAIATVQEYAYNHVRENKGYSVLQFGPQRFG